MLGTILLIVMVSRREFLACCVVVSVLVLSLGCLKWHDVLFGNFAGRRDFPCFPPVEGIGGGALGAKDMEDL